MAVLLDLGADPNALDDELSGPLHLAALAGNALGVHALLRGGADPDAKDLKERSAFFCAVSAACLCETMDAAEQLVTVLEALAEVEALFLLLAACESDIMYLTDCNREALTSRPATWTT